MNKELKPCPFCDEELQTLGENHYYAHPTNGCILQHLCFEVDDKQAIEAWNRRLQMNKPKLIDANELKDIIDGSEEFIDWQKREICECIDCCDTAYNVDAVVEQLEALADEAEENWKFHASLDSNHARSFAALYNKAVSCYTKAIEIVKGGAE